MTLTGFMFTACGLVRIDDPAEYVTQTDLCPCSQQKCLSKWRNGASFLPRKILWLIRGYFSRRFFSFVDHVHIYVRDLQAILHFFHFLIQLNQIVQSLRETTAPFVSLSVSLTDIIRAKSVTWKEQEARAGYNVCPQHSFFMIVPQLIKRQIF